MSKFLAVSKNLGVNATIYNMRCNFRFLTPNICNSLADFNLLLGTVF